MVHFCPKQYSVECIPSFNTKSLPVTPKICSVWVLSKDASFIRQDLPRQLFSGKVKKSQEIRSVVLRHGHLYAPLARLDGTYVTVNRLLSAIANSKSYHET